jgi:plastocyanin
MRFIRLIGILPVTAALLACGGGGGGNGGGGPGPPTGPSQPGLSATVTLGASSFNPANVPLLATGTVTFTNNSGIVHNVTFAPTTGAPANIADHASGSNQRTFNTVGVFEFECTLHAFMTGQVVVQ